MIECPTCNKFYKSLKSLHRHKTTKHPETIGIFARQRLTYESNPKKCKLCDSIIPYKKRNNTFCNSSCGATHSNNNASPETRIKRINWWRDNLGTTIKRDQVFVPKFPKSIECNTCTNNFVAVHCRQHYCSPQCNTSKHAKATYRSACRFIFSQKDYPELYNFNLIKSNGWYVPSNKGQYNPDGVTWDHLFRISDGYKLNIDPTIMSHPANAEMVTWRENISRSQSTITYTQLIHRINNWIT